MAKRLGLGTGFGVGSCSADLKGSDYIGSMFATGRSSSAGTVLSPRRSRVDRLESTAMRWGRFDFQILADTDFRLDGGAMFGVIPKVLWERVKPADETNRILMTTHSWLVRTENEVILVDTGIGDKLSEKTMRQFGVPQVQDRLPQRLAAAGVKPEDVTQVVLTHLHFDHCGWNTIQVDGQWVPTFPNAKYWIQRQELAAARKPNPRDAASYDPRNWEPLFKAGVVELFDAEAEPVAGLKVVQAPGHTAGMCIALLDGDSDGIAAFWADLVPTSAHVATPWVMGYDLFPVKTMETKQCWLDRAFAEDWLSVFQHDPDTPMARLVEKRPGRFVARAFPNPQ